MYCLPGIIPPRLYCLNATIMSRMYCVYCPSPSLLDAPVAGPPLFFGLLALPPQRPNCPPPSFHSPLLSFITPPSFWQVTRGVMYTREEAEGRRLRNPFDTITEGIGINRLTTNFEMASIDGAFRGKWQWWPAAWRFGRLRAGLRVAVRV